MVDRLAHFVVFSSILASVVGCNNAGTSASMPPPNFNGPVFTEHSDARPQLTLPKYTAVAPKVGASSMNVPREWIPNLPPRPWKWIVIHHSASATGCAATFDREHRNKGWDELGYHFVVGNGTQSGNGQVEVGPRWPKQKWGAHAKTADNKYNDYGIGICLVGNFEETRPTQAQLASVARLVAYLQKTYNIPSDRIIGHRDTKQTLCPGANMNVAVVRRMASGVLADAGEAAPTDEAQASITPSTELLVDQKSR